MILSGNKKIKLFAGAAKVKAAYMGAVKVYPNASLKVTSSLAFAAAGGSADLSILVEEGQVWSIAGLPAGWSASATSGTGPASVSISAPNNTSTGAMNGRLTVSSDDLSATCSLAQAAGKIVYGNWQNVSLQIDTTAFPASGGSSRVVMAVRRDWTWNGVANTGGTETSTASIYSPQSSDGVATFNGNNVLVASLGVAFKAAATITISAVTEHDSTRKSASITQAANYVTEGYNLITRPTTYPVAPAGEGTIQVVWDSYPTQESINALWGFTWASGVKGSYTQALTGGTLAGYAHYSWTGASGNFTYLNTATGAVSVASKGTAVSGVTGGPTVYPGQTLTFTNNAAYGGTVVTWEDVTTPCSLQQEANVQSRTSMVAGTFQPDASWIGATTPDNLPAERCYIGIRYYWNYAYTSGAANTSGWSRNIFYADGLRIISNPESMAEYYESGGISVYSRGTTVGPARSCQVYVTYDGFTSNTITLTQRANAVVTNDGYSIVITSNPGSITALGGSTTLNAQLQYTRTYTSGSKDIWYDSSGILARSSSGSFSVNSPGSLQSDNRTFLFTVSASQNNSTSSRSTTITLRAASAYASSTTKTVSVTQAGQPNTNTIKFTDWNGNTITKIQVSGDGLLLSNTRVRPETGTFEFKVVPSNTSLEWMMDVGNGSLFSSYCQSFMDVVEGGTLYPTLAAGGTLRFTGEHKFNGIFNGSAGNTFSFFVAYSGASGSASLVIEGI